MAVVQLYGRVARKRSTKDGRLHFRLVVASSRHGSGMAWERAEAGTEVERSVGSDARWLPPDVPEAVHRSLLSAGCHVICEGGDSVAALEVVSVAPNGPSVARVLGAAAELPEAFLRRLVTPNPLNFRRNVRSAPPSPAPVAADPARDPLAALATNKQVVNALLGGACRARKPRRDAGDAALVEGLLASAPPAPRRLPPPALPPAPRTNLAGTEAGAPSLRGATTRRSYLREKKLPQVYTVFELLAPHLPPHPVTIVDVGGGRGDLALNLVDDLRRRGRGPGDRVVVVDANGPSLDAGRSHGDAAITWVEADFRAFAWETHVPGGAFATVGLHTCGSLADLVLNAAAAHSDHCVVVPCCYSKCVPALSPWLPRLDGGGERLCRLCERNDDYGTSFGAMRVVQAARLRALEARNPGWTWESVQMDRAYSKKNLILVGHRRAAAAEAAAEEEDDDRPPDRGAPVVVARPSS